MEWIQRRRKVSSSFELSCWNFNMRSNEMGSVSAFRWAGQESKTNPSVEHFYNISLLYSDPHTPLLLYFMLWRRRIRKRWDSFQTKAKVCSLRRDGSAVEEKKLFARWFYPKKSFSLHNTTLNVNATLVLNDVKFWKRKFLSFVFPLPHVIEMYQWLKRAFFFFSILRSFKKYNMCILFSFLVSCHLCTMWKMFFMTFKCSHRGGVLLSLKLRTS